MKWFRQLDRIEAMASEIIQQNRAHRRRLEEIMATLADLQTAVGNVATDVTTIGTDAAEILKELKALRDAGTGGIDPTALDPIIASLTAVHDSAKATAAALEAAAQPAA